MPCMTDEKQDGEMGMGREITRRDFLNGVAIGVGGTLVGASIGPEALLAAGALDEFAPEKAPDYYPPAKMGSAEITMEHSRLPIGCATEKPRIPSEMPSILERNTISSWLAEASAASPLRIFTERAPGTTRVF